MLIAGHNEVCKCGAEGRIQRDTNGHTTFISSLIVIMPKDIFLEIKRKNIIFDY